MIRPSSLRVPAVVIAAGTLLSACAAAGTTVAGPPSASVPAAGAAAPLPAPERASAVRTTAAPSATAVPAATSSTWADLLASGTVVTTAAVPTITAATPRPQRVARTRPALAAAAHGKVVYLTFDDGPSPKYTKQILALLARYDAKATFFVIGRQTPHSKRVLRAEYRAGNGIGNHTWDHRSLRHMSKKRFRSEILRTQASVKAAIGVAPVCLRPPGGSMDKHTRGRANHYRLKVQLWTTDTADWKRPGASTIAKRALRHVHSGSVILLHDGGGNRAQTVHALKVILRELHKQGYRFGALCR